MRKDLLEAFKVSLLDKPGGVFGICHHFLLEHFLLLHHDLLLALHDFFLLSLVDGRDQRMNVVQSIYVKMI